MLRKFRYIKAKDKIFEVETAVQRTKKRNTGTKQYEILTKIRESEDATSLPLAAVQQRLKGAMQG